MKCNPGTFAGTTEKEKLFSQGSLSCRATQSRPSCWRKSLEEAAWCCRHLRGEELRNGGDSAQMLSAPCIILYLNPGTAEGLPRASPELRRSRSWSTGAVLMFRELDTLKVSFSRCGEELEVNALAPVLRRAVHRCFRHPASPRHRFFSEVPEEPSSCCLRQQI